MVGLLVLVAQRHNLFDQPGQEFHLPINQRLTDSVVAGTFVSNRLKVSRRGIVGAATFGRRGCLSFDPIGLNLALALGFNQVVALSQPMALAGIDYEIGSCLRYLDAVG